MGEDSYLRRMSDNSFVPLPNQPSHLKRIKLEFGNPINKRMNEIYSGKAFGIYE